VINGEKAMNSTKYLLTLHLNCEIAVEKVTQHLIDHGLQILRSFDLETARKSHTPCSCPLHGTENCNCQMIILLVYDQQGGPLSLVAHGHDGETHFVLADPPQEQDQQLLRTTILHALNMESFAAMQQANAYAA
jgi:hypothetical protein